MYSEFCPFLLHHFLCLMLFGNVSYTTKDEDTFKAQPTYAHLYGSSTKDASTKVVKVSKNNFYFFIFSCFLIIYFVKKQ